MEKTIYFTVIVLLSQSILISSRQIDYDTIVFPDGDGNFIKQTETSRSVTGTSPIPTKASPTTSSTTASPTEASPTTPSSTASPPATVAQVNSNDVAACIAACLTTPQYNPVCGTNRQTYDNKNKLECAQFCGTQVDILHIGICKSSG